MYGPIDRSQKLPAIGRVTERATLDFKAKPSSDSFEIAKDVAAMANAHGGTLLIGAAGDGEFLHSYQLLSRKEASGVQRAYEQAVRDRCFPRPVVTVDALEREPGRFAVAVNVQPFPGQLVGVKVLRGEAKCGTGQKEPENLFYFAVRVGSHTVGITPEQLPMYLDARIRRLATCLEQAKGQKILLRSVNGRENHWISVVLLKDVDIMSNAVTFVLKGERPAPKRGTAKRKATRKESATVSVPLDFVSAAWKDHDGWKVMLGGRFREVSWAYDDLDPLLRKVKWFFAPD